MVRIFLYFVAIVIALAVGARVAWEVWQEEIIAWYSVPTVEFEEQPPVEVDVYADQKMWFTKANKQKLANWLPRDFDGEDGDALGVPTFFVHPTSYLDSDSWNGPLDHAESQGRARIFIQSMASPFARAGNVWAPKYRQAAYGAFLTDKPEAQQALDLAYDDVSAAFDKFLLEIGDDQPFILAGHSQGAMHVLHLLKDRVAGTPMQDRVVAAYVIGWPISIEADLPALGLKPCDGPEVTGCVASYESFADPPDYSQIVEKFESLPGLAGKSRVGTQYLCYNPLRHAIGGEAEAELNLGTLKPDDGLKDAEMIKGAVPARCDAKGFLIIGDPPDLGPYVLPGNNYHVYDIPLFWRDMRLDVERRVRTFLGLPMPEPKSKASDGEEEDEPSPDPAEPKKTE